MMDSSAFRSPSPTPRKRFIFNETIWLGGKHDGYPLTLFDEYLKVRGAPAPNSEPIALYQSLCTFGVLEAVMGVKIPESTLLRQDAEGKIVMTDRYLPDLLQKWRDRIRQSDKSGQRQWADRLYREMTKMHDLFMFEMIRPDNRVVFFASGHSMEEIGSIFRLTGCITEAVWSSWPDFPFTNGMRDAVQNATYLLPVGSEYIKKSMVSNGWCPFTIEILSQSVCVLSYASTQKPYVRDAVGGHQKCTETACAINTIDASSYSNIHAMEGCTCAYSKPSLERVVGSLENRKIPIVLQPNDSLISSDGSKTPYIAISHVWADGLGSTTEVGLPTCQINRLASIVRHLIPSGAFWMDALCVPGQTDMRKRAIGLMAETYRNADAVLVIDSGIRSCSLSAPPEERLLHILSSGWMQRLWTLQEGLLAQKLIFEFADGFATLGDKQIRVKDKPIRVGDELILVGEDVGDVLISQLAAEIFRLRKYRRYACSNGFMLGDVANSLRWRTTSRAGDETLAISGLLNVDAFELVNLPASQRMMTLLLRVQKLPSSIIFNPGPKLNEFGFRWAPETMMTSMGLSISASEPYKASCTPQGLIADYVAVFFKKNTTLTNTNTSGVHCYIRDYAKERFYKVKYFSDDAEEYSCRVLLLMSLPGPGDMLYCVACRVVGTVPCEGPPEDPDGHPRVTCEYQGKLVLMGITAAEFDTEWKIAEARGMTLSMIEAETGRMRVLMT